MVTESQRLDLLRILALATFDMDRVVAKMKELGHDTTPEEIRSHIEKLKAVRGI